MQTPGSQDTSTDYAPSVAPGSELGAIIATVEPDSPAARAGLTAGMMVEAVDDEPLRDIIDWLWLTTEDEIKLTLGFWEDRCRGAGGAQSEGARTNTLLHLKRDAGESWGIGFTDSLFDGLKTCCNACIFCFMTMLPKGMRPSLYERDDDYRLSFLQGNFVTLTNMSDEDVQRVIEMRLSPLHVSLHAILPKMRKRLMGKHHARGIEVLEQLLNAGIEIHAQLVLLPGVNDGEELDATLTWIAKRSGILSVGIVPYGFTKYAKLQGSFTAEQARAVLAQLAPYQRRSREADGTTRFQLADEWYLLAGAPLPPSTFYDDYPQYEDGIGMLRSFVDEWGVREDSTLAAAPRSSQIESSLRSLILVTGEAFAPVLCDRIASEPFDPLLSCSSVVAIKNNFFGGNVTVAGLLTASDVIEQLTGRGLPAQSAVLLPPAMFNADGLTLDDYTVDDIARALNRQVLVVPLKADSLDEVLETCGTSDCCSGRPT